MLRALFGVFYIVIGAYAPYIFFLWLLQASVLYSCLALTACQLLATILIRLLSVEMAGTTHQNQNNVTFKNAAQSSFQYLAFLVLINSTHVTGC